ncbi:unnamed protein product [Adineta steineri]|uniref:AMP-binding enzyme C-terminal domain-containing protein n=1 Tax=Adineta steineri TaxID=433720 RepID=A0A815K766_9BILA|nr:unnamed protein product [Adineta steineri]CAF1389035.1 unnamed protein product [Adineta steineri]
MNSNGLIHYVGRRDFQVKLRGQRIELQEIVQCLLIDEINVEQLRQHCQSDLPSHMIPSIFVILEKLPLNPNGKVDRKRVPPPDLSLLTLSSTSSSLTTALENSSSLPQNQLQNRYMIFAKGQHDGFITKDASVDLIYLGARLHHYDCLLEGEVSLSNLLCKIRIIIFEK